jgi:hypothetical protein
VTRQEDNKNTEKLADFVDSVADVTKNKGLHDVADKVREFENKWGTGKKKK